MDSGADTLAMPSQEAASMIAHGRSILAAARRARFSIQYEREVFGVDSGLRASMLAHFDEGVAAVEAGIERLIEDHRQAQAGQFVFPPEARETLMAEAKRCDQVADWHMTACTTEGADHMETEREYEAALGGYRDLLLSHGVPDVLADPYGDRSGFLNLAASLGFMVTREDMRVGEEIAENLEAEEAAFVDDFEDDPDIFDDLGPIGEQAEGGP